MLITYTALVERNSRSKILQHTVHEFFDTLLKRSNYTLDYMSTNSSI